VGISDGAGVGDGVGCAVGAMKGERLSGQPTPEHSKLAAAEVSTVRESQLSKAHVKEQAAPSGQANAASLEQASPPVHVIEIEEAPLGIRMECEQACFPQHNREHG